MSRRVGKKSGCAIAGGALLIVADRAVGITEILSEYPGTASIFGAVIIGVVGFVLHILYL